MKMRKVWRVIGAVTLLCLVIGIVGICVGLFMGSSPVILRSHGNLDEYIHRLQINWGVLRAYAEDLLQKAQQLTGRFF